MSEYLHFPFLSGATIEKGSALTNQDQRARHTVPPLPAGQAIQDKIDHQKEVEVEDPKIDGPAASEATSSSKPIRTLNPPQPSDALTTAAKSREDRSPRVYSHNSANHSMHNYFDDRCDKETHSLCLGSFGANTETGESSRERDFYVPSGPFIRDTDVLERFENLQADFEKLIESHAECGDMAGKLV
uniref:Uncharacterized protein n=1 Tax=Tanacetum cinerariifolium TaxID=118510 RepID=A0A699IJZ2_TANCI|nr:hypothetical protein [Tanacetum cinerariifolium]